MPQKDADSVYLDVTSYSEVIRAVSGENLSSGFPTRSYTNWTVQPQKMIRGFRFGIQEVEGWYYQCSKNKGSDQLCG